MNALNQAGKFNKAAPLTGEQPDDLQPFDAKQFAQALSEE